MKIIVMGCGRVGGQASMLFGRMGHSVTVIDHDANALARLGADFKGRVVKGLGFDRKVLLEAGIQTAEAFVAASSSDNANIVAARIARNFFSVPRVVARLYDPLRAEIYQRLGLTTISTTGWGAERIVELVTHSEMDVLPLFRDSGTNLVRLEVPVHLAGHTINQLNVPSELQVIAITRADHTFIPVLGTDFREGDVAYLVVTPAALPRLEQMIGLERM